MLRTVCRVIVAGTVIRHAARVPPPVPGWRSGPVLRYPIAGCLSLRHDADALFAARLLSVHLLAPSLDQVVGFHQSHHVVMLITPKEPVNGQQ